VFLTCTSLLGCLRHHLHSFGYSSPTIMETHLYGDSNVVRFLQTLKDTKSDPSIQSVSLTKTTNEVLLRDALSNPTTAYPLIIMASLTNLLTSKFFEDFDMVIDHCKNVFNNVQLWIQEGRDNLDGFASQVNSFTMSVILNP
jgi:hypothetical protein